MTQATTFSVPTTGPASPDVFATRTDNNFVAALSGHSGASRPTYAAAGTIWQDTSVAGLTRFYLYDGTDDVLLSAADTTNNRVTHAPQPWVDLAGGSAIDIGAVTSENVRITGSGASISALGTAPAGTERNLLLAASNTIVHNGTSLILFGANISAVSGDSLRFSSLGSGNWRCIGYTPASGYLAGSDWTAYTPIYTGFGTVSTSNMMYSRAGKTLLIQGTFVPGTPTGTEARVSLPGSFVTSSIGPTLHHCGSMFRHVASANFYPLLRGLSQGYFTFGTQSAASAALSSKNGNDIVSAGNVVSIDATIPLA